MIPADRAGRLLATADNEPIRDILRLDEGSRVLLIGSEGDSHVLTLRATEVPEIMFMDTPTASGDYDEAITRRDVAQLTEASFLRFNREMISNRQVVTLAKMR